MDIACELVGGFLGNVTSICISDIPLVINWVVSACAGVIPVATSVIAPACSAASKYLPSWLVNECTNVANMILGYM